MDDAYIIQFNIKKMKKHDDDDNDEIGWCDNHTIMMVILWW